MSLGVATLGAVALRSGIIPLQSARGWVCSLLLHCTDSQVPLSALTFRRQQHVVPERQWTSPVPEAILRELHEINSFLAADSCLDGRRRRSLVLSAHSLPAALPPHDLEPGLPSLDAHVRPSREQGGMARCAVKWLRRSGRVPGQVHSLMGAPGPGGQRVWGLNVHFDEKDLARMVRAFGRNGCTARVLQIKLVSPPPPPPELLPPPPPELLPAPRQAAAAAGGDAAAAAAAGSTAVSSLAGGSGDAVLGVVRVKPVRLHVNAVSQRLEGIEMVYCPPDRIVKVDVPIRLINDEMAPGVRKGGWMCVFKRTVRYKALGNAIPPFIEVNVRHMDLDQDLLVRDLPIPPGTKIYEKNFNAPVVRCTTDVGQD